MDEPIFVRSGKWFFRDEDGEQSKPFDTREQAETAFKKHKSERKDEDENAE